jgi:hypothetical protein
MQIFISLFVIFLLVGGHSGMKNDDDVVRIFIRGLYLNDILLLERKFHLIIVHRVAFLIQCLPKR